MNLIIRASKLTLLDRYELKEKHSVPEADNSRA